MPRHSPESRATGRLKVRNACQPCKDRKRKCDGRFPCSTCVRFEYDCNYAGSSEKVRHEVETRRNKDAEPDLTHKDSIPLTTQDAMSGVAFTRAIGSQNEVAKPYAALGWNMEPVPNGQTALQPDNSFTFVASLISPSELDLAVRTYFSTIGALYPLIGFEYGMALSRQSLTTTSIAELEPARDAIVCGMAILGLIFIGRAQQPSLLPMMQHARRCLDIIPAESASDFVVVGWALRTLFLRTTGSIQGCWLASCTMMHLAALAGLDDVDSYTFQGVAKTPEESLSVLWSVKLLNMWISFEFGQAHVQSASGLEEGLPPSYQHQHTSNVLGLYASTQVLNPALQSDPRELEESFESVEKFDCAGNDALGLSRCVLAMAIFRRRFIQTPSVSTSLKNRLVIIGREGLLCVERLLQVTQPWWHLANLPLQFLCLLLIIDNFSEVPHVFTVFRHILVKYPSERVKETIAFAENVVGAVRKRKNKEAELLNQCVSLQPSEMSAPKMEDQPFPDMLTTAAEPASDALPNPMFGMDQMNWAMFPNTGLMAFDMNFNPQ